MLRYTLPCLLTILTSLPAVAANSVTYAPSGGESLLVLADGQTRHEAPMPCKPQNLYKYDASRLVATCVDKPGLLIVDIRAPERPRPMEIMGFEGKLLKVYLVGDQVWVDIQGDGSVPLMLSTFPGTQTEAPLGEPEALAEKAQEDEVTEAEIERPELATHPVATGTVLKFEHRDVFVDLGTQDGFKKGDTVEFFQTVEVALEAENVTKDETISLGRIKSVTQNRAVVEVPLNIVIPTGTRVRFSREAFRPDFIAPARNSGITEYILTVRPYIALGALGGGGIIDASVVHRFEFPMALQLNLSPLGFALTNKGNAGTFAAHAFLTYDARVFQVGLGAGVSRFDSGNAPSQIFPGEPTPEVTQVGFSAGQFVRLGAHDGLNFTATTNFVVRDDEFEFGGLSGAFQIPLSTFLDDTWLIFRGGGGLPGHAFGEVGLRTLILGNGNKGSLFITPTIGGANIKTQEYGDCPYAGPEKCLISTDYGGPMVGATVEWRP